MTTARTQQPSSSLDETDPSLSSLFNQFAFNEVVDNSGPLDEKTRLMLQLGAIIACQGRIEFRTILHKAMDVGVSPVEAKEVVYQAIPYVGMAKGIEFVSECNELLLARGVTLPLPDQSTTTPENRLAKGLATQKEIFGSTTIEAMYANAPPDQKHIQTYLSGNCFGDYYTRTGLDLRFRELLTFAILVAMGGCETQVAGHVKGNVNVGNGRDSLVATVSQLLPFIGYPRSLNALKVVNEGTKVE